MVKKLFKHEFLAWLRVLPIIYIIVLTVAAGHRILQIFENDSVYYDIVSVGALFMYAVGLMVCLAAPTVFGIVRFYKNFFTGEGYLTFTLPVTPANHLWVKSITALVFGIASILICLLSAMIITAGEVFTEICLAADYIFKAIPENLVTDLIFYVLEYAVLMLVSFLGSHLFYGSCICLGQLFRKNRVLAAVGVYFIYYIITQVFSTIMTVVFMVLGESGALEPILKYVGSHITESIHIALCGSLGLAALMTFVYYVICHWVIRRKLNLE